jgi:peptidyl-Lys metalloendopeptidase
MRLFLLAASTLALAAVAPGCFSPGTPPDDLDVDLAMRGNVGKTDAAMADVTVTNVSDHDVQLLSWYLPDAELQEPLFQLMRDGQPVRYIGPMYKRAQPDASDFVTLTPGQSFTRSVDLAKFYDLSATGDYTVEVTLDHAKLSQGALTGIVGSSIVGAHIVGRASGDQKGPNRPTCTSSQLAEINSALPIAGQYAAAARNYLSTTPPSGTPRYTTWFGAFNNAGWTKAQNDYAAIANAFATQTVTFDCSCKQKNVYAYVQPNQPYLITVCGAFWTAPESGTDSKAGTMVHEMSHFTVTAGTSDWAYGKSACMSLATTDPTKALDNADSHEYFAENTPAQN